MNSKRCDCCLGIGMVITLLCLVPIALAQPYPCPPAQIQQIRPANCGESIFFGQAISVVDDRLAVGRYNSAGGRVTTYLLDRDSGMWEFEADLVPPGLVSNDIFGYCVGLRYDSRADKWLLSVGAQSHHTEQPRSGAGYVYELNGLGEWVLQQMVLPDENVAYGSFGTDVAWVTSGTRSFLVFGAPGSESLEVIGSVYVFEQDGQEVWQQMAHLQAPDGAPEDAFGHALAAVEGQGETILVVGAYHHRGVGYDSPGKVYIYRFDELADDWTLEDQFESPEPLERDAFGFHVSISQVNDMPGFTHRLAVGRPLDGPDRAYLYLRTDSGDWQEEAELISPVLPLDPIEFGRAVDLATDGTSRVLVGASNNSEFDNNSGSAFLFERNASDGSWNPVQGLYGRDTDKWDAFGAFLSFGNGASTNTAIIGSTGAQCIGAPQESLDGAVYVFELDPADKNGECPAPVLRLQKTPNCSGGGQGGNIEVRWFQASPGVNSHIALLYGRRTGSFVIPNGKPCAGTVLGLGSNSLQIAWQGESGAFGAGRIVSIVPRAVCGGYLQVLDLERCVGSNVVRIE